MGRQRSRDWGACVVRRGQKGRCSKQCVVCMYIIISSSLCLYTVILVPVHQRWAKEVDAGVGGCGTTGNQGGGVEEKAGAKWWGALSASLVPGEKLSLPQPAPLATNDIHLHPAPPDAPRLAPCLAPGEQLSMPAPTAPCRK